MPDIVLEIMSKRRYMLTSVPLKGLWDSYCVLFFHLSTKYNLDLQKFTPNFTLAGFSLKKFENLLRCDFHQFKNKVGFSSVVATAYCVQTDSSESMECG